MTAKDMKVQDEADVQSDVNTTQKPRTFAQFYQFYLSEHQNVACRRLHFVGTSIGLYCFVMAVVNFSAIYVVIGLLAGYGCAWVGHFFFEKNKPASFKYPLYSFLGDWRMFADVLRGKLSLIDASRDRF